MARQSFNGRHGTKRSVWILMSVVVAYLIAAETIIMYTLHSVYPELESVTYIFLDSGLLLLSALPIVYIFIYRPMNRNIEQLSAAHDELVATKNDLDRKVAERTEHLMKMSEELEDEIALRRNFEMSLHKIAANVSQKTGVNFFESLFEFFSNEVDADYAILGEYKAADSKVATVLAFERGKPIRNFEYSLEDTPCEAVIGKETCFYPKGIQQLFPKDKMLADMGVEGYIGIPLFFSDGAPSGIMAILSKDPLDETKSKKIQSILKILSVRVEAEIEHHLLYAELSRSERRFRELAEMLPGFVFELDKKGKVLFANQNAIKFLGYQPDELETGFDIISETDLATARENFQQALSGKKSDISKYTFVKKSGEPVPVAVHSMPFYDQEGRPAGLRVIAMDVTEMEAAERSLRESEEKYRTVFESSGTAMMILDRQFQIRLINAKMMELLSIGGRDIGDGGDCSSLISTETCEAIAGMLEGNPDTQKSLETTLSIDGVAQKYVSVNLALMPGRQQVLVSMHDMTKTYRYQEEALRAAHMASIGELAAGVAHEVNNPVNIILLEAQMLRKAASAPDAQAGALSGGLGNIINECGRITSIVKALLSFARKDEDERVSIALGELLGEALSITSHLFRKSNISLKVDTSMDAEVLVNPKQIIQVILNILINAQYALDARYPEQDPDKILEIRTLPSDSDEYARISFIDHGTGMSREVMRNATTPFFTTKPRHVGTGLGLSISHTLVRQNGGIMLFESEPDKYTNVSIDLPKAER